MREKDMNGRVLMDKIVCLMLLSARTWFT